MVPLCLMLPAAARAQSAGDIATSPLPSFSGGQTGAAGGDNGAGGKRGNLSLLPNLFDQLGMYVGLSERYTDNATGASGPAAQPDWETRGTFGLSGAKQTQHTNTVFTYGLDLDYFAKGVDNNSNVIVTNNLNAGTMIEVIPDHIILQAQAYASPVYTSRLGNVAPAGQVLPPGANSNVQNSYGYNIQPDFTFRLGDFLRSDTLPSYSTVYYDSPEGAGPGANVANQITKGVTERLSSGDFFARMQWGINASYSETGYGSTTLTQRSATGEVSYAIDHGISVVGDAGYQTVKAHLVFRDILDGPIFMGGMKFDLARLTGEFRVGEQYHSFSLTGHLNYQITPRLTLGANAQDGVNTPGAQMFDPAALFGALIQGLQTGQIQIPSTGINLNNLANVVGLDNSVARFRNQNVVLNYVYDEFTLSASGYNTEQSTETPILIGENYDQRTTGASATLTRGFTPELSGSVYAAYHNDRLQVGTSDNAEFGVTGNYLLNNVTSLYAQADYLKRFSSDALASVPGGGDVSVFSVIVGIRHTIQ